MIVGEGTSFSPIKIQSNTRQLPAGGPEEAALVVVMPRIPIVSTLRWLVSVFPATTGAGNVAFTNDPAGAFTLTRRQHPPFVGALGARQRIT
jgi:hypothetical protein